MERGILGNAIRNARIRKGYFQEELAELIGITPMHMKHLEGEHRKPSIEVLIKLMETLDLSFDSLVFSGIYEYKNNEWPIMLTDCSERELNIIRDLIFSIKKNRQADSKSITESR